MALSSKRVSGLGYRKSRRVTGRLLGNIFFPGGQDGVMGNSRGLCRFGCCLGTLIRRTFLMSARRTVNKSDALTAVSGMLRRALLGNDGLRER